MPTMSTTSARGFPLDRYTPHGYLDNPRHSWRAERSGVVRSTEGIGFAWHFPSYPGPYSRRWIYEAALNLDLDASDLYVEYHTKELFRYRAGAATVEMWLDGDALLARVEAPPGTRLGATARYRRQLGLSDDWDFGLLARQARDGAGHLAVYAEGTAFVLLASQRPTAVELSPSDADWPDRSAPIEKWIRHHHVVAPRGQLTVVLARAESSLAARRRADNALADAERARSSRLEADMRFWSGTPRLAGDWPEHWRRGFVYDIETLRTIVRPPAGVYRSRWDGMQIQVPRVVLAETALDMLLLSYADPATAQEVVLGTLEDTIAPNVPCTREDGSVNMVALDGSACGTSPAWCWPFWCVGLLYRRTGDREWLGRVVPHLEAFLDWWLANRCHADGSPYYLCGWESGQDASPRFNAAERGGGGIEGIKPVDLMAALAQSARLLADWLEELGRETVRWRAIADDYAARTRALWHRGWFHDWTGVLASDTPDTVDTFPRDTPPGGGAGKNRPSAWPTRVRDPMQLAPLMCRVATPEQVATLRRHFAELPSHGAYSPLEWPPVALTVLESALQAGEADWVAATAAGLLERVWSTSDAARATPDRPLPGVAHEHWPLPGARGDWGTEGYGWGATTVLLFLRYVAGVRDEPERDDLRIEPRLPAALMRPGARYQVLNLPWRGDLLDLTYSVAVDGRTVEVARSMSRK